MPGSEWQPIEPLAERDGTMDLAAIRPLYDAWRVSQKRLREAGGEAGGEERGAGASSGVHGRRVRRPGVRTGSSPVGRRV